ncbi:Arc family DNA-binding protein [Xenorhabdus bovienii]|uniref:Arc family DNA-binding protein n=1 Tax=Xenorhabdus bovienii TaxID=40576 RepID=UPI00237C6A92|nr:Arc family DNA-binding protein [Xenorhabdus bovienii]MDE1487655.1 Arc family DNA-binding protein [Xenorhabdus bovienii]MDE9478603.1 Arc family DNA-binding protein [Xenorhabdus bovienii]MDE9531842.1 Arc family DNA-binding protein [Xenorhabdus bovienii]MDE9536097.1 Arc family DNA-binding protein [Xenorhabdus bovienii]MDE9589542.1 Arc family DNA-binding protein [Xenorhabdus bovienii]
MTKKYPSQEMDRFNVRMPTGMRDEITKIAEKNGRSMNTEIIMMLQEGIDNALRPTSLPFNSEIDESNESQIIRMKSGKNAEKEYIFSIKNEDVEKAYKEAVYSVLLKEVLVMDDDDGEFNEIRKVFAKRLESSLENRQIEKASKLGKALSDKFTSKTKK